MKNNIIYVLGILTIIASFALIITYPESGRLSLISGALFPIGIGLNVVGYLLKKELVKQ